MGPVMLAWGRTFERVYVPLVKTRKDHQPIPWSMWPMTRRIPGRARSDFGCALSRDAEGLSRRCGGTRRYLAEYNRDFDDPFPYLDRLR